jgi:hypothetical protein
MWGHKGLWGHRLWPQNRISLVMRSSERLLHRIVIFGR